jgi:FG-GAP-like repeat
MQLSHLETASSERFVIQSLELRNFERCFKDFRVVFDALFVLLNAATGAGDVRMDRNRICNFLHTLSVAILFCGLPQNASALGFQTTNYPAGVSPNSVAVGDFNGDGKPDLVVADSCWEKTCSTNYPSDVVVLLGKGNGTFRKGGKYAASISGSDFAVYVTAADLNGDGILDLVVVNDGFQRRW